VIRCAIATAALGIAAGCPPSQPPANPQPPGATDAATAAADQADAAPISDEVRIAAIQHAMNQLAPVANQCWAAGAVDDYLLKGTLRLEIEPSAGGAARVVVTMNTTDDAVVADCMTKVAAAYAWPKELAGEVFELPFTFDAPDGQYVIDRRLVPVNGQAGVGVAVLIDNRNTNNPAASMFEVAIAGGKTLALAKTTRHEVWYVVEGGATLAGPTAGRIAMGDALDVPAGAYRGLTADGGGLRAMVVAVPGGNEGTARAGALGGETVFGDLPQKPKPIGPRIVRRDQAKPYAGPKRAATLYLDPNGGGPKDISLGVLSLEAGAAVPPHVHAKETEMLYVLAGKGTMTVAGVTLSIESTSVVQVPANVEHAATMTDATTAIQIYTPAGPEQRFKKP
jgi:quercetin dioxygenase-like cupin family protein